MRILLTGASGQLGRALRPGLERLGTVAAPARTALDLARAADIERGLDAARPELIVNTGAFTDVDGAEGAAEPAQAVNGEAPGVIGGWAARAGAAVIHISTDYVFDGTGSQPLTEADAPNPIGVYGTTKLAGEAALLVSGATSIVLRTGWLYGPVGDNFCLKVLGWARQQEVLKIAADQTGSPTTTLWLAEVVCALIAAMQKLTGSEIANRGGLYHACCHGAVDRCSFAREIVAQAGTAGIALACREIAAARTADFPAAARRPAYSALESEKLEAVWGIAAPDWRDALGPVIARLSPLLSG